MAQKRTKLVVDFDYDFILFGISSSVKFYKLAWAINNQLDLHLVRDADHIIEDKTACEQPFGMYTFRRESEGYKLYKNRSLSGENVYLLPEFIHFDYLLKTEVSLQSFSAQEMIKELKEIKWIEYIADLQVNTLKSRDNFLS
ncbi:IPExxxVDY family protein [Fulvivirga sp. M361]|uniref:IPExxxVDY family protein n=1 Tax=Fulvivirga sp. M361 TaxID=2594266 RepID=UPI00117A1457|nr:IPExxxVDY family protein [Fulvivirga sp. M361]TRX62189.1 IPExxxVDY family protein [Fulvivirga sp. M361]